MSKFRLEPFNTDNAALVLSIRNAENVRANSFNSEPVSPEEHHAFLDRLANTRGKGYFVVYYDDILAGTFNISVDGNSAYWGCALQPDARNIPGLFIGLVLLSGRIAFENMALQSIRSEVLGHNTAPIKVNSYLKIPVVGKEPLEGADRKQVYAIQYRLDIEAWPDVKKRAERLMTKTMFSAALSCSIRLDA